MLVISYVLNADSTDSADVFTSYTPAHNQRYRQRQSPLDMRLSAVNAVSSSRVARGDLLFHFAGDYGSADLPFDNGSTQT